MNVSFDFDGTLSNKKGRELLAAEIANGNTIFIITRRRKSFSESVYAVAKEFKIPRSRVIFTDGEMKWHSILKYKIDLHYDNNPDELKLIRDNTSAKTKLV